MPTYINNEEQHNKFWEYTQDGLTIHYKWGRIGGNIRTLSKKYGSHGELEKALATKIRSKEKKKYKQKTKKELKQEVQTAKLLGPRFKISRMQFVSQKGNKLTRISNYDPKKYVYVEILNSWKKTITRLLLSKTESFELVGGVSESNRTITYGRKATPDMNFVAGVRSVLRRLSEQLVEVIKTIKFAAVGARKLFDDDDDTNPTQEFALALAQVDTAGIDSKVISNFASMGARVLEL
jgi:predicted DNA-binding WGR domain protein